MSTVFHGILIARSVSSVNDAVGRMVQTSGLKVDSVTAELTAITLAEPRRGIRIEETAALATSLSHAFDALFVLWDDRVGTRVSALYQSGKLIREFGPEDELWVPLNDDGRAMTERPPLCASELDEDGEYETSVNAIALGLREIGAGTAWTALRAFIVR